MQIREHARAHPAKPAVILHPSGTVLTFAELEGRANRIAHHFRASGLREGDVVAILMDNNEHIHAVMWGARRCGLYYVPINTHLTPAEADYIIGNSRASAIVGSSALAKTCENLTALPELRLMADGDL
ncbi:MAG TPA: AMP-binding protein, partial [Mycobacterium sp.]|nr:AMP-binding protein [Mycobacterium sp.]